MTETQFGQKLKKKLEVAGWLWEKIPQGRFKGGWPDVTLIDPYGDALFLELKVGANVVSRLQKIKLRRIDKQGATAIIGRLHGEISFKTIQQECNEGQGRALALDYCKILKTIWEGK